MTCSTVRTSQCSISSVTTRKRAPNGRDPALSCACFLQSPHATLLTQISCRRTLSVRSKKEGSSSSHSHFSFATLRGAAQPELSKKLFKLIKSQNHVVSAYETAGKERLSVATQLADWGSGTNDDSITEISDKVAVILSELGEQEDNYAHSIDDSRSVLKSIRDTEKSVQPTRDGKQKLMDKIQHLKSKEPESAQLVILEQELVRAEAENLVAEAQLTNVVSALCLRISTASP